MKRGKRLVIGLILFFLSFILNFHQADASSDIQIRSVYTNEWQKIEQAKQRPIAVMMPTDKVAQPSYGIGNAKVLYEIMEEGSISRQMAIIDDWKELKQIGNIRSCRLYYIPIATEWDPIMIHFGGVYYMKDRITAPDINNLSGTSEYGVVGGKAPGSDAFFRAYGKSAPHNAYIRPSGIIDASTKLGYSLSLRPEYYQAKHFSFANGVNTLEQYGKSAISAQMIDLSHIFPYSKPIFHYNEEDGLYYKTIHHVSHVDGLTGQQLSFSNIIVQNTKWEYEQDQRYLKFQVIDDEEDGYYFTQGRAIHIHWKKEADYSPTLYYDDLGNEIQLNTGKTYIAIAQKGRYPNVE